MNWKMPSTNTTYLCTLYSMTGQKIYLFIDGYNHLANKIHANKEHKFGSGNE